ncbi:Uma2 family endonuclease [Streptomyces lichenis]|uniref:Uma2 family endonuclease n=1 Tax=Streptomyces lichenis TaxID=2306967 RepID=A0ABT0I4A2_9ACTN|nr:Uma2 family endonuclease [Streptomyces lichenis]MCK8676145.1 Uma2 family endonuclease [Streptomyces lichenis]
MNGDAIARTTFPEGYTVLFGTDGKMILAPRSAEHSSTIRSMQIASAHALGRHAKVISDVHIDFPGGEHCAPDFAVLREDASREGARYGFVDVLLISEVVSTPSARKDYDDCTVKYGRYGVPVYLVVDPYAREVVLHTEPTFTGYSTAHTRAYGTGTLAIPLADGRTFTLDLDEWAHRGRVDRVWTEPLFSRP